MIKIIFQKIQLFSWYCLFLFNLCTEFILLKGFSIDENTLVNVLVKIR